MMLKTASHWACGRGERKAKQRMGGLVLLLSARKPERWNRPSYSAMSVARSGCHLFTNPLKSPQKLQLSVLSTHNPNFSSILPTPLPYPLPDQHHLRSGL
jgi:hypothetical protein